ncbi:tRNA threonylcarbamoyl adenosine modification protein, Sua5/YciO/YrdC/YwlC family [Actinomyces ruminicola]|uniref:tRNA threonylcarbamoyl adenosine modification protein, Sua5/YciO/YrdC/YwlC family n=2 Tax=Actinomyces ruminicola TaxID=332524 RepID=A0A1G9Y7U3_9ACTO|nr:tRNA threonylcarbamoyl adenosine modification protein, Sua5/YciO/YrdC/YwlC family [Actinomyces ruminicola]
MIGGTIWRMSRYIELHPVNPQARLVTKVVDRLRDGELIAYPTDSGYALACAPGNKEGLERIRTIRQLDSKHNFTFVCANFAQVGPLAIVGNNAFRLIKRLTPGPWTFILKGTKEVPRMTLNPKKHTLGVRIPDHAIAQALVKEFGAPILSSTLIRPGRTTPESNGWEIEEELGHLIDVVIEGPVTSTEPTTVIDLTDDVPEVAREGAGDISLL